MAKIVRYNGNLKAFASEQLTNERTLFGQVTIANDLTSQITAQFLRGWGIVGPSDQPSLQDFNAAMYTNGQLLAYLHQMGVAEYNAGQEYFIGSVTQTGGVLYMSLTDANIGNTPSSSPVNWKAFTADQATEVALGLVKIATQALTNAGADDAAAVTPKKLAVATQGQKHTAFTTTGTATAQVLTPTPAIGAYATGQRFNVTFNVGSGTNPTMNISGQGAKFLKRYDALGAKIPATFSAQQVGDVVYDGTDLVLLNALSPVMDASETVKGIVQLANAAQIIAGTDAEKAVSPLGLLASFLGAGGTTANDYVAIPYRDKTTGVRRQLIVQFGTTNYVVNTTKTVTFPIEFPNAQLGFFATPYASIGSDFTARSISMVSQSKTNAIFNVSGGATTTTTLNWISIGW